MPEPSAENPYQPPVAISNESAPLLPVNIHYEAAPTLEDLRRALRSGPAMVWDAVMLAILSLALTAVLLAQVTLSLSAGPGMPEVQRELLIMGLLFGIPTLLAATGFYRKLYAAERYLKRYPRALMPRTGELTSDGFLLSSDEGQSWWPHTALLLFQHPKDQWILAYDLRGASKHILPERGFSDPVAAAKLFAHYAKHNPQPAVAALDERALEPLSAPVMFSKTSEQAIEFSGMLRSGDLANTPLPELRKNSLRKAAAILVLLHLGLIVLFGMFGTLYALLLLLPLLLIDYAAWFFFTRTLRPMSQPETALMQVSGWVDENGLTLLNNIEQSVTRWSRFDQYGGDEQVAWLRFDRNADLFLLLHRRFFRDDSDWLAAQRLMQQHVGGA